MTNTLDLHHYIPLQTAMKRVADAGMKMNIVTLMRIAQKKGFLHQPTGKFGKCWVEKEAFEEFIRTVG